MCDNNYDALEDVKRTERGKKLLPNTRFFSLSERENAYQYSSQTGSYVGECFNQKGEWIGYYVPA